MKMSKVCLFGFVVLCALGSQARADVLAYETFQFEWYEVGQPVAESTAAIYGFAGAWQLQGGDKNNDRVVADSLEVAGLPPSENALTSGSLKLTPGSRVGRFLDTSSDGPFAGHLAADGAVGAPGTSIFLSFVMKPDSTGYFWAFEIKKGGLGDEQAVLYIGNDIGNPAGRLQVCAFRNRSQDASNIGRQMQWAGDVSVEPELYVLRVDFQGGNADDVYLWRNPSLGKEPAVTEAASLTDAGDLSFDAITLAAFVGPVCAFDEICIGETFWDVVSPYRSEAASVPCPAHGATEVPRDNVVLRWEAGKFGTSHDVYLGTTMEDVKGATSASPEFKGNQAELAYALDRLELGTTYYWRIDEVNDLNPDSPWKGDVWSFTIEPIGYVLPADLLVATASSAKNEDEGPEKVIDGSGLSAEDLHSVTVTDMWRTRSGDAEPWIEFAFVKPFSLHQLLIWNHNLAVEPDIGFGIREAMVQYSMDGINWTLLDTVEFAQATGRADYQANTAVPFEGAVAQYVRVLPISNWGGGIIPQCGLSEVRFLYVPLRTRAPEPISGATDVAPQVTLKWWAGRQSVTHEVYLSDNEAAVVDGTSLVAQVSEPSYQSEPLHLGKTYYWRVDEVNETAVTPAWQGDIWSFTVRDVLVVEDFESYTDNIDAEETIYQAWIDGYEDDDNGSFVGYGESPFAEQSIVRGGRQSMPISYKNVGGVTYSEAKRTLDTNQDWTQSGIQGLVLYFHGDSENTGGQLYVKINDIKVPYDGNAQNLTHGTWNKWYIELPKLDSAKLAKVNSLSIGIDGNGEGVLYVDDIILTAEARHLITPVEPEDTGLVAHWKMDEDAGATTLVDSAGGDNNATVVTGTTGVPGKFGNAIQLRWVSNPVTAPDTGLPAGTSPCTISVWFQQTAEYIGQNGVFVSYGTQADGQYRAMTKNNASAYRAFHWAADMTPGTAASPAGPDVWHHVAFTFDKTANMQAVYLDGILIGTDAIADEVDVVLNGRVIIGDMDLGEEIFNGFLDDLRIYNRVLSAQEIAWLGGRIMPFDQ